MQPTKFSSRKGWGKAGFGLTELSKLEREFLNCMQKPTEKTKWRRTRGLRRKHMAAIVARN